MIFTLKIPPSINQMYKQGFGHWYKDKKVVDWQEEALWEIKLQSKGQDKPTGMIVKINWYFDNKRKNDIDGPIKILLDTLVKAKVIKDDSDILKLEVTKYLDKTRKCLVEVL